ISGYTGTNNGLGVAASTAYPYNATSKSYSFDATALTTGDGTGATTKVADVLKAYAANGDTTAQISIGGSAQDVIIASDGTLTDVNG
ncbi:flagellin FliC, partial [Escherichia coli]